MQNDIPHFVVIPDVVGTEDVHALGVLAERTTVVVHVLGLVAHPAGTRTETHDRIVNDQLQQGQHRNQQVKGQESLPVQLRKMPLQKVEEGHVNRKTTRVDVGVRRDHPLPKHREKDQHEGENVERKQTEVLSQPMDLRRLTLQ